MPPIGLYLPGDGLLHRWHPLTKLAIVLAALLVAPADLLPWQGVPRLPWVGVALLGMLAAWDAPTTLAALLRRAALLLLPIVLSLVLVQGFFFPGADEVLWELGPLALKREGLLFGATIVSRLVLVAVATLLLVLTTDPADLTQALADIGLPREIAYIVLVALQLLPRIQARAESIQRAQQARGLRTEGSLWVRGRALLPLVGPLITSVLHETEERALALEARAFRAPGPKSSWREIPDSLAQRVGRWLLVAASAALLLWGRWQ